MQRSLSRTVCLSLALAVGLSLPLAAASAQTGAFAPRKPSPTASYLAGVAALEAFDAQRAAQYFMAAAESDWENEVFVSRAFLAYLIAGNVPEAATIAQHLVDLDPANELARLTLGTVALKQRRYASADRILSRIPDATLVGVTGGIMRSWAQIGAGNTGTAFEILDSVGAGGFEEFLVFHRAIMADIAGEREQAIEFSRQAFEAEPYVTRIAEAYIRILANAGNFEEAQAVLGEMDEEGISHPLLEALRAPVEENRRPGLFAANVQSGAAEMLHGLGAAMARDGSLELGMVFLQLAQHLDPDAAMVAMTLGDLLSTAGRHGEAEAAFGSIPASSPLRANALVRLAELLDQQERREEALSRLHNITLSYPDNVEALGVLGDILRYDEQWEEAADAYTRLIALIDRDRPRDWRYFYVRGIAYERSDRWPLAEADFQRALQLNPDQPYVLNYLGYSWVDQGINLEEALEMIEYAVEMMPDDGYIIDSLGWAFYKLGRIDEAIVKLEKAVNILPDDPEINDHLGDVYWVAGREREAMFQWRIAIDVDESGNVTERAAPKLINGLDPDAPIE